MSESTQPEVLQELSNEWKHRNDAPTPAKTGRGRRGKAAAKAEEPAAEEPKEDASKA